MMDSEQLRPAVYVKCRCQAQTTSNPSATPIPLAAISPARTSRPHAAKGASEGRPRSCEQYKRNARPHDRANLKRLNALHAEGAKIAPPDTGRASEWNKTGTDSSADNEPNGPQA